jgi:hypothetical protein
MVMMVLVTMQQSAGPLDAKNKLPERFTSIIVDGRPRPSQNH